MKIISRITFVFLFAAFVFLALPANAPAQQPLPENQQPGPSADPIRDLNLSPEQRERIRAIREEQRDERAAVNQRLRETNRALEEVLDSENPSEAEIERHLRAIAEAQAASLRMRVGTEMKVRKVLTADQLATLRVCCPKCQGFATRATIETTSGDARDSRGGDCQAAGTRSPLFPDASMLTGGRSRERLEIHEARAGDHLAGSFSFAAA